MLRQSPDARRYLDCKIIAPKYPSTRAPATAMAVHAPVLRRTVPKSGELKSRPNASLPWRALWTTDRIGMMVITAMSSTAGRVSRRPVVLFLSVKSSPNSQRVDRRSWLLAGAGRCRRVLDRLGRARRGGLAQRHRLDLREQRRL